MFSKFLPLFFLCLIHFTFSATTTTANVEYTTDMGRRTGIVTQRSPPVYEINLDLSYKERWRQIAADYEDAIVAFIDGLGLKINTLLKILDSFDYYMIQNYNKEFALEVRALSELMSLSFTEVTALNFIYEMTSQCTSIVAQDSNGNIIHARNLDFYFADLLGNLVFHGKYYRKGQLVYEAITLAGYTGLLTGIKANAYSFSLNQYTLNNLPQTWDYFGVSASDLLEIIRGRMSPTYVVRQGFETIPDYEGFVKFLKETKTISNVFYIVAGTKENEGTIITKFRENVENVTSLDVQKGRWYVLITNYNSRLSDPARDNRATAAREWMDKIGQTAINKDNILEQVMKKYPVFNNLTFHTSVMQPQTNYFNTMLWW